MLPGLDSRHLHYNASRRATSTFLDLPSIGIAVESECCGVFSSHIGVGSPRLTSIPDTEFN